MTITDITNIIFDEHQKQCGRIAKEIYPIIENQLTLFKCVRNYKIKPVPIKKTRLTAMNMCYISFIMVLEGEYYG